MNSFPSLRRLVFVVLTIFIACLFLLSPRRLATLAFVFFGVYPVLAFIIYFVLNFLYHNGKDIWLGIKANITRISLPEYEPLRFRRHHLFEMVIIVVMVLFATRSYLNPSPTMRVTGHEIEWLTGHGQVAYQGLQDTGVIPLWNPYYRVGEPLIDNAFSYIFNPFSSVPQLLLGGTQGTKVSVIVNAFVAAVGGWFLGWVMGLSSAGRLILALLILGKGNMHANFQGGYFQLATQQVYFAWAIAGVLAIIRHGTRWSTVITAVSLSLLFLAGNLWHLLPMIISIGFVLLVYGWTKRGLDMILVRRMLIAVVLTLGLSSVMLLRVVSTFGFIDNHPDEVKAGWEVVNPNQTYLLPFVAEPQFASYDLPITYPTRNVLPDIPPLHFYYSFVAPWWLVLLILLPIPILWREQHQHRINRRLWWVGITGYIVFTWWGMGGTPLFLWLYEHVPMLAQWRFVPRALGMASFWVAVLVALRFDVAIQSLFTEWKTREITHTPVLWLTGLLLLISGAGVVSVVHVNDQWHDDALEEIDTDFATCMTWLGKQNLGYGNSLWIHGYDRVTSILQNGARIHNIEADFLPTGRDNTLGEQRLSVVDRTVARRLLLWLDQISWYLRDGFRAMKDSPGYYRIENCIYENKDYFLPYAFTFNHSDLWLVDDRGTLNPVLTDDYLRELDKRPEHKVVRLYDTVAVRVMADSEDNRVLAIQELAFPGWEVWVDGDRYPVDVFAQMNAVVLPADGKSHDVIFMYRPPLFIVGAMITLITALGCSLYLLRVDRFIRRD